MREVWAFFKATGHYWFSLMSCAVFTFLSVVITILNKPEWIVWTTAALAFVFALVACFLAWRKEYRENISGLDVVLNWSPGTSRDSADVDTVTFESRGTKRAYAVKLEQFEPSEIEWHRRIELASLDPGEVRTVRAEFVIGHRFARMHDLLESSQQPISLAMTYCNDSGYRFETVFTFHLAHATRESAIRCMPGRTRVSRYR